MMHKVASADGADERGRPGDQLVEVGRVNGVAVGPAGWHIDPPTADTPLVRVDRPGGLIDEYAQVAA